jgi:predicted porin
MNGIHVNLQCEQFTYVNHFAGGTGWCNRNSKIALAHPTLGEIMFATWLLPYNEAVAQWVDPFYDAGADSHTSIMGSVGANTIFYNTGQFEGFSTDPNGAIEFNYAAFALDQGFNRRQEHIIQYWSPNVNGFVFRYAQTAGSRDETPGPDGDLDPVIRSTSLAYENGPFWAAATYQEHEDWAAARLGDMNTSDADSYRFAARYIMDLGDGMSIQISAMYEDMEYDFRQTISVDASMRAFGYGAGFNDEDPEDTGHEDDDPGHFAKTYLGIETGEDALADAAEPGGDITFEREAFLISGKVKFGGPLDFRFSYMDADDLEISCAECDVENDEWESTAADAWNVGLYYTMPAGTELRLTYSEVSNDANGTYGQGISGTGLGTPGGEVEMIAFGIVHWFD